MTGDTQVEEAKRTVFFADGAKATFKNVTMFNASGSFLRIQSDEGYILINTARVNYMIVDGERVA